MAGRGGDLSQLNPATLEWTVLGSAVALGAAPPVRCAPGFAAGSNATLYVFGGIGDTGVNPPALRSTPPDASPPPWRDARASCRLTAYTA
jgi:hypothetical protein